MGNKIFLLGNYLIKVKITEFNIFLQKIRIRKLVIKPKEIKKGIKICQFFKLRRPPKIL